MWTNMLSLYSETKGDVYADGDFQLLRTRNHGYLHLLELGWGAEGRDVRIRFEGKQRPFLSTCIDTYVEEYISSFFWYDG